MGIIHHTNTEISSRSVVCSSDKNMKQAATVFSWNHPENFFKASEEECQTSCMHTAEVTTLKGKCENLNLSAWAVNKFVIKSNQILIFFFGKFYIYIYAFSRRFFQSDLQLHSGYTFS